MASVEDQMVQDARRLMGAPPGVDIRAVREEEVRHVEVTVDDGPGERGIQNTLLALRAPLACIFLDPVLRHVWTGGVVILDIAQRRRAGLVEPALHPREVAHAGRMRQIVRHRPDAGE